MTLNILKMKAFKSIVIEKKNGNRHLVTVIDFDYSEDDAKVILRPEAAGDDASTDFSLYLSKIESADRAPEA